MEKNEQMDWKGESSYGKNPGMSNVLEDNIVEISDTIFFFGLLYIICTYQF